ncbi:hypothetical protein BDQ17DRAFT_1341670 [Cyathus striatus]|nr:hypothetical protein BDQ17DRAFT_1341670 [Cyathus striatus]
MSAWYTSWLPSLPSLKLDEISSNIQGRFLSFILKKTLGHLLKPGQLDSSRIDSQIGSGYVQVNDLELDSEAINGFLNDTPVVFDTGTITSVTARIPWPNPLKSQVGFFVKSLHLAFYLNPKAHPSPKIVDLADSVASIADSFIHEELSPHEEAALWQSLHGDMTSPEDYVPGSLNPFKDSLEPELPQQDDDREPAGVSIFATLIERLLAKFEFAIEDMKITLIHKDNMSITASFAKITYKTDDKEVDVTSEGETRSLKLTGLVISGKDLRRYTVLSPAQSTSALRTTSRTPPPTGSPASSSSSLDEETELAMSQSLAFLPPRPLSPASSVASSMYQSAISTVSTERGYTHGKLRDDSPGGLDSGMNCKSVEATLLSFGTTPITLQMRTPPPLANSEPATAVPSNLPDGLCFTLDIGVIACAIHPWTIRGLVEISDCWKSHFFNPSTTMGPKSQTVALNFTSHIRSIIAILITPDINNDIRNDHRMKSELDDYFLHPLIPPDIGQTYVRVHVEEFVATYAISVSKSETLHVAQSEGTTKAIQGGKCQLDSTISDISVFFFRPSSPSDSTDMVALPILISDPNLPFQYNPTHLHPNQEGGCDPLSLPKFEVKDWTHVDYHAIGPKLSHWRTRSKPKQEKRGTRKYNELGLHSMSPPVMNIETRIPQVSHTLRMKMEKNPGRRGVGDTSIEVSVAPLHIFMDIGLLHDSTGILKFIHEATEIPVSSNRDVDEGRNPKSHSDEDAMDITPPTSPGLWNNDGFDTEQLHRERLILEDLDLGYDFNVQFEAPDKQKRKHMPPDNPKVTVTLSMIRLEIRCPSPRGHPPATKRSARIAALPAPSRYNGSFIASIECKRIVLACSPLQDHVASVVLSVGSLAEDNSDQALSTALSPRITITQLDVTNSVGCSVELPSIHIDVSKPIADAIQYWADDVTQFFEHGIGDIPDNERVTMQESSLIGSRYFVRSRTGSGTGSITSSSSKNSGTVLNVTILEAFCRLQLPRTDVTGGPPQPFDFSVTDMNVVLELQPHGKEQTVITLDVMDLVVKDTTAPDNTRTYLSLTSPRSMTGFPKPMIKLRFTTRVSPGTTGKESHVKLTLDGFTYDAYPDIAWISEIASFVKSPPGTFESVIPSERTCISLNVCDGSIRLYGQTHPGGMVIYVAGMEFSTDIVGDSSESSFKTHVQAVTVLSTDDMSTVSGIDTHGVKQGMAGYALVTEMENLLITCSVKPTIATSIDIEQITLRVHLCADTASAIAPFINDVISAFQPPIDESDVAEKSKEPTIVSTHASQSSTVISLDDESTFHRPPELGPSPDMIDDDLPTNLDYLDESYGAAGGLRELTDEDLEDDSHEIVNHRFIAPSEKGIISQFGSETIKMLQPEGIRVIEDYFDNISVDSTSEFGEAILTVRVKNADFNLLLYDGYDWVKTRRTIEEGVKEMRKRLNRIRQLVANGHGQQPVSDETSKLLFNSVYVGIEQDIEGLEPADLIAAIDKELKDDIETGSQSSWQSLRPADIGKSHARPVRVHGKRLTRSKGPSMEIQLAGTSAAFTKYDMTESLASRIFVTIDELEILDHIKTSSWNKFLTNLRSDSQGNARESDSSMVRIELRNVRPDPGLPNEEARLKAKILPLRLHVDQDALDFFKNFFSFKDQNTAVRTDPTSSNSEAFIQLAEIFPVDLKLDYKPRRVDYRALREGKTIELMNFFHFDGAEMTLRHITLTGVTGWPRLFDKLNDLWTPDVKATQLAEVISGVAPIRSVVNVGSGVADLVLLPIAQYRKDGRIVRGIQKGATAFMKSTAIEAIKMGARLATGTQVILEQAEGVLGGQFKDPVMAEPVHIPTIDEFGEPDFEVDDEGQSSSERFSKYADQPADVTEGFHSAFKSVKTNMNSAAQTILAVPMEVYERSGSEGPIRSVIRAVPIAVIKPMIGASEAISKALLGLHNTLDPNLRHENEAKYKQPH